MHLNELLHRHATLLENTCAQINLSMLGHTPSCKLPDDVCNTDIGNMW